MTASFGYTIFYVPDVEATVGFFTEAFGIERRFVTPENDYGELATGSTTLAFAAESLAADNLDGVGGFTPLDPRRPPAGAAITLLTDDVAGLLDAAERAGGRRYLEPTEKPWGQTVAYLIDPSGILVELATPMAEG